MAESQALTETEDRSPPVSFDEELDFGTNGTGRSGERKEESPGLFGGLIPDGQLAWLRGMFGEGAVRKAALGVGLLMAAGVGFALFLWSQDPVEYRTLYGELSSQDATKILEVLDGRGITVQFDERTGEIRVPPEHVHRARIFLASEGLPRGTGFGYEMLERDTGFGVSEFLEHARFDRALETELARSIETLRGVRSARVHLDAPQESVFVRDRRKPRASIVLQLDQERRLSEGQVEAIIHLVASAVADLDHENISVVDHRGRLLTAEESPADAAQTAQQFEFTRRLEERLQQRVEDLVEPLVGPGRVRAQVSARLDFSERSHMEELFDPAQSAIRSEQMLERGGTGPAWPMGIPGALTNQPPGPGSLDPDGTGDGRPPGTFGSSETRNWEVGRVLNQVQPARGALERLTVGVLIDHRYVENEEGQIIREPLSDAEMERIGALVRDAVGYDEGRGDAVSVVTVPFAEIIEPPPPPVDVWEQDWVRDLIRLGVFAAIGILIYLVAIRPIVNRVLTGRSEEDGEGGAPGLAGGGGGVDALTAPEGEESDEALRLAGVGGEQLTDMRERPYEAKLQAVLELVENEPELAANAIRSWIEEDDSKKG